MYEHFQCLTLGKNDVIVSLSASIAQPEESRGEACQYAKKELNIWLILAASTVMGGVVTDSIPRTNAFPVWLRTEGLAGMLLAYFPLKRTGRLLSRMGEPEEWGCTSKLVTTDIYRCLRHPHHTFIGVSMTSLGLAIGHVWSFILIVVPQWIWIFGFLFLIEEKELLKKFGEDYEDYRRRVPMLIGNPVCILEVLSNPISGS
jgi:protein-S-isoprenylcysteine O-methyltransferase Ste14